MFQSVAQLGQTGDHRREIARVAGLQFIQKLPHGASAHCRLIKFYGEVHGFATSFLMYPRLLLRWCRAIRDDSIRGLRGFFLCAFGTLCLCDEYHAQ